MDSAKAAKKAAKAQAKLEKKRGKAHAHSQVAAPVPSVKPAKTTSTGDRSMAERSALAAEKQVRLQKLRVLLAALMFLVALVTLLVTTRQWERRSPPAGQPSSTETRSPDQSRPD